MTDDAARKEALRKEAIKANHGRKILVPSTAPIYPAAIEREYRKLSNEYIETVKKVFLKHWAPVRAAAAARTDDINDHDFISIIRMAFDDMEVELTTVLNKFGLKRRLIKIAQELNHHSADEFARMLKSVSIDITSDRFMGEFFQSILDRWVRENVDLITTLPHKTLYAMRQVVLEGYMSGQSIPTITKAVRKKYKSVGKSHARLIARDQTAKLFGAVNQSRQEAAGIKEYTWICCMDGRQRKRHEELHNTRHSWDDPPVVDPKTGRRCHPGQDYQCRCRAKPVIDLSVLDL